jgi:hypothetical protein
MALADQLSVPKVETSRTNRELKLRGRLRPPLLLDGRSVMALSPLPKGNTMMVKVVCTCGHVGIVSAESLPRDLVCSRCGSCRHVEAEDGTRIVNRVAFEEWLFGAPGAPRA